MGMKNTFFADPTGLSPNNVSTASNLVKLAEYILKNYPKISEISSLKEISIPGFGDVTNTNRLVGEVPGVICSKTGFTQEADGCLLLIMRNQKKHYRLC